jgi:hypothetical protein
MTSSSNSGATETKRSQWLNQISAYLDDDYEFTEYGKSKIKVVLFKEEDAPLCLLSHIWNEYDSYARAMLQWLRGLGEHPNFEVRLRAAAVVGQLAIYEFRPVREEVILPWAKSDKQSVQKLASLALTVVAYADNEDTAQQSLKILHHWSGLTNSPRLRWTAIAAYGGYIGLLFPQEALENIEIIAQSGDARFFSDIAQALSHLFDSGEQVEGLHLAVLSALKRWSEQGKKTPIHQLSLLVFWGVMHESKIVENQLRQPTLLWLAKQSQNAEEKVSFLLKKALDLELTRDLILAELLIWLQFVDQQQDFYKTIARIIFTIVSQGEYRERLRILEYLKRWSIAKKSSAANQVLLLLRKHFEL